MKYLMALTISLLPLAAIAQPFVELGLGQSKTYVDTSGLPAGVSSSKDEKDTTFNLSGGYMFHPMVGLEVGYRNLGEASASATNGVNTAHVNAKTDGFTLGALGAIPLGASGFSIAPRAGLFRWSTKGDATLNGVKVGSADDKGTDYYFGVGVNYSFTKNLYAGLHAARFRADDGDVDVFEIRAGFKF